MIIPYYDNDNKIYFYEGRALINIEPKYLSRVGDYNNIYNYYTVDKNKIVTVLEGVIDSLFIENSISLTGFQYFTGTGTVEFATFEPDIDSNNLAKVYINIPSSLLPNPDIVNTLEQIRLAGLTYNIQSI